jgi:hypothetical protein
MLTTGKFSIVKLAGVWLALGYIIILVPPSI